MKKLIIPTVCLLLAGMGKAQAQAQAQSAPPQPATAQQKVEAGVMKFETMTHDYGEVPEGPQAEYDFVFTNVGKKPVIISDAQGSCGCTRAKWPSEPILPGQKGKIHVMYNTDNRPGAIDKIVTVTSNAAQSPTILHIKGSVKPRVTTKS